MIGALETLAMQPSDLSFSYDPSVDVLFVSKNAPLPTVASVTEPGINWINGKNGKAAGLTITDFKADWRHHLPALACAVADGFGIHLREAHEVLKWHLWDL